MSVYIVHTRNDYLYSNSLIFEEVEGFGLTFTTTMEVRLFDLIFHNRFWKYLVTTCNNELRFLLMLRDRNMWFISLTCVEENAWTSRLGVVQASLLMDDLFIDDCSIKCPFFFRPLWTSLELGLFHSTPSQGINHL